MPENQTQKPFIPARELKKVRVLSPQEKLLLLGSRQRIRRERRANYQRELMGQKIGIAETIGNLWKAAQESPDIGKVELIQIVEDAMAEFRLLTFTQLHPPIGSFLVSWVYEHPSSEPGASGSRA